MAPEHSDAVRQLQARYRDMSQKFAEHGFNISVIAHLANLFKTIEVDGVQKIWAKEYKEVGEVDPCVRLLVLLLPDSPVRTQICDIANQLYKALPPEWQAKTFVNDLTDLHVTIFHTSHPDDIRPNALVEGGGKMGTPVAPTDAYLQEELQLIRKTASTAPPLVLELDRVIMADSGVLLALWVEHDGRVDTLRSRMRGAFPGCCPRQNNIIHSSLLRVLLPEQPTPEVKSTILAFCERATEALHGMQATITMGTFIYEHEFSTIHGVRHPVPFATANGKEQQ